MARNKYPEETRKLIIETAGELFISQGYEGTSIQDIINHLGGLSKGAVYYHFKSKEEILWAVADELYSGNSEDLYKIAARTDLNGFEKVQEILRGSYYSAGQKKLFSVAPDILNNPQLLTLFIKNVVQGEAVELLTPVIEEGMKDGSIKTEYPKQLAEVLLLIGNMWTNPMVYHSDTEELIKKMRFFQYMLKQLGLDVIDDDMIECLGTYSNIYSESRSQ